MLMNELYLKWYQMKDLMDNLCDFSYLRCILNMLRQIQWLFSEDI